MTNPWLEIPLADYEGHMGLPGIAQAQLLADVFAEALAQHAPRSVAVLGCAGGNGLERIAPQVTRRVVGVDLNPDYLEVARARHAARLPGLELIAGDIQTDAVAFAPVELAFAGLLFEYVDVGRALQRIRSLVVRGGILISVVQLPSEAVAEVTPSPFPSLRALAPVLRLVRPEELERLAVGQGYVLLASRAVTSAGGKSFQVQTFMCPTSGAVGRRAGASRPAAPGTPEEEVMNRDGRIPLLLAAACSLGIAALHVAIAIVGPRGYRYFGAPGLAARVEHGSVLGPTLLTLAVAALFVLCSLYALSGARVLGRWLLLRTALVVIGVVYTLRGLFLVPGLVAFSRGLVHHPRVLVFSAVSLLTGIFYLVGVARAWPALSGPPGAAATGAAGPQPGSPGR
ncbi:MAG TPA: class I SAM-dependent methyltransferase [Candidatus Saccharimonadales bacterium]|nr:class I SAM-dependent methyltransferase [Candidatus Saccharimonadales bacterium]